MSIKYITWAFEVEDLNPTQRVVLLSLADWSNDEGICYPGQMSIADKAHLSVSTVRRTLNSLADRGLVTREERRRDDGYRTSDLYRLHRSPVNLTGEISPVKSGDLTGQMERPHRSTVTGQEPSVEPSVEPPVSSSPTLSDDAKRILKLLEDLVERNGSKRPSRSKRNMDAARLILNRDERPVDEVMALIRWCQGDSFWSPNILSMAKFREKYDQLRLKAKSAGALQPVAPKVDASGRPAPYGVTAGGRAFGPPPGPNEHQRAHYLGRSWSATRDGRWVFSRVNPSVMQEPNRRQREILEGKVDD